MEKSEIKENWQIIKGIHEEIITVDGMSNGRLEDCVQLTDSHVKYKDVNKKLIRELKRRGHGC